MEIDPDQFDKLISTIGSEPSFSFASGATWAAIVSALIAIALFVIAYVEAKRSRLEVDSNLILNSFKEYDELYESLKSIPVLAQKHKKSLELLDLNNFDAKYFALLENDVIDSEEWQKARSTKNYFKGRFELVNSGFFSNKAIAKSMDRAGADLVAEELRALDTMIFYQVKRDKYSEGRINHATLRSLFDQDLLWYKKIPNFMKKNNSKFGWKRK